MDFTEYDVRLAAYAVVVDSEQRILLSWYNGAGHSPPGWTLPGGVEFDESIEEVGGTTDLAAWLPLDEVSLSDPRAVILDVAIRAWREARQSR